jgi:AcrR family transcriptional regulator
MASRSRSQTPKGALARARILRAAEPLFATHGWSGASMRDVAKAAGLPLATVVYHFAQKERLYGAILGAIADQLLAAVRRELRGQEPASRVTRALVRWALRHPGRVRLLLRELLDNPARVSRARSLPLAPVLTSLAAIAGGRGDRTLAPELAVLHVFGALSYVIAARPTLRRIFGARERELFASYEDDAVAFASRALRS